jgi:hypothetical protein
MSKKKTHTQKQLRVHLLLFEPFHLFLVYTIYLMSRRVSKNVTASSEAAPSTSPEPSSEQPQLSSGQYFFNDEQRSRLSQFWRKQNAREQPVLLAVQV